MVKNGAIIGVNIPPELKQRIRRAAFEEGVTPSALVRRHLQAIFMPEVVGKETDTTDSDTVKQPTPTA